MRNENLTEILNIHGQVEGKIDFKKTTESTMLSILLTPLIDWNRSKLLKKQFSEELTTHLTSFREPHLRNHDNSARVSYLEERRRYKVE